MLTLEKLFLVSEGTQATISKDALKDEKSILNDPKSLDIWEKRQLKTKRKLTHSLEKLLQDL